MRRLLLCGMVCAFSLSATPASAGYWSWLEEYSGPGPFTAGRPLFFTTPVCRLARATQQTTPQTTDFEALLLTERFSVGRPIQRVAEACVYFDYIPLSTPPAGGFDEVNITNIDVGVSVPFANNIVEIGAGVGRMNVRNGRTNDVAGKWAVTPFRLVTRPLLVFASGKNDRWEVLLGSFKVYFKQTALLEPLTAADFGGIIPVEGQTTSTFTTTTRGEMVRSYGWVFDLTDLVSLLPH